jgi:hypothetical protein
MSALRGHQPKTFQGQRGRILRLLLENKGREVPAYLLAEIGLQYCARVAEIRKQKYVVENRTERVNGQVHGYYKLVAEPGEPMQAEKKSAQTEHCIDGLFGSNGVRYAYPD